MPFTDLTLKTKDLPRGIVNHKKRRDTVTFSWKVSQDWVVPGFRYQIEDMLLFWPVITHRYGFKKKTTYRVYFSQFMYNVIQRICEERWPNYAHRNNRAAQEMAVYHD